MIFPLIRVQISPQRFSYVLADIPSEPRRFDFSDGKSSEMECRYTALLTGQLNYMVCDRIEKHFARHGKMPDWTKSVFLNHEGLVFDDWANQYEEKT